MAELTILNAALGLAFHVAPPFASDVNTLFKPALEGIVTVPLKVAALVVVNVVNVEVPDAVSDDKEVAPVTFTVDENVAAPPCAEVDDNVVAPLKVFAPAIVWVVDKSTKF